MAKTLQLSILALSFLLHTPSFHSKPATFEEDLAQYIYMTNKHRAEVNVPPLQWNKSLAQVASDIAGNLVSASLSQAPSPAPSEYGDVGTTTYVDCYSNTNRPENAVRWWYRQKGSYNYTTNSCIENRMRGDYTQMVWKNSTEFGCSTGVRCIECGCPQNEDFEMVYYSFLFVCAYSPPGNIPRQRPY